MVPLQTVLPVQRTRSAQSHMSCWIIRVSVLDCDTKNKFCRYDPGSSPQREAQIQRQDAQKRRLIAYKSDLRVIVISVDIAYCIGCT